MDAGDRAPLRRRWSASGWDDLVIVGWLLVLTVVGAGVRTLLPVPGSDPPLLLTDVVVFAMTVLPVWAYLAVTEAGGRQATWGKRRTGLRVVSTAGARPGPLRSAVRNGVELLPWQLAHVAVARIVVDADAPGTIAATYALSLVLAALSIVLAWRDPAQRALHDRVAGTLVVRA